MVELKILHRFYDKEILEMEMHGEFHPESKDMIHKVRDLHLYRNASFVIYVNRKEKKIYVLKNRMHYRDLNDRQLLESYKDKTVLCTRNLILNRDVLDEHFLECLKEREHIYVLIEG